MNESMIVTFDHGISTALVANAPKLQRKAILQGFGDECHLHLEDVPVLTETWRLTNIEYDTILLRHFIKSAVSAIAESVVPRILEESFESVAAAHGVNIADPARSFIIEHNLEKATLAAVKSVSQAFTNIHEARLDLDPGDEEEDDHPWVRVYIQTGMSAASTLKARRQFYKLLDDIVTSEESSFFHLAFRVVS